MLRKGWKYRLIVSKLLPVRIERRGCRVLSTVGLRRIHQSSEEEYPCRIELEETFKSLSQRNGYHQLPELLVRMNLVDRSTANPSLNRFELPGDVAEVGSNLLKVALNYFLRPLSSLPAIHSSFGLAIY